MAAARNSFGGRRDLPLAGEPSMEARAPAPHLSHAAACMVRKSPSLRHWMASREVGGLATGLEPRHGGLAPCLRPRRRPQSPPPLGGQHAIRGLEDLVGMRYTSSSERGWWRIEMREAQTIRWKGIRLPRRPTFLLAPDDRREALPYFLLSHISTTSLNIWTE